MADRNLSKKSGQLASCVWTMFNQGAFAEISAAIMKACVYADSAYWKLQHVEVLVAHLQATFDI